MTDAPRPTPSTPSSSPAPERSPEGAARSFLGALEGELRREVAGLEPPEFDEIARAADGELDASERLLWAERLAADPALAARAAALAAFRAAAYPAPQAPGNEAAGRSRRRELGRVAFGARPLRRLAAVAAALGTVALALLLARDDRRRPQAPIAPAQAVTDPLFADGFEAGDASNWSDINSAG